jgi:SAM-dependent methyltransferase
MVTQKEESEWFTDENFWRDLYPVLFPDGAFAEAQVQVDKIIELTGVGSGAALDLCCGPGRHIIPLAKRGFQVTGVDRTPFLLEIARARATEEKLSVELVQSDMREFVRSQTFDLIVNIFTSFGYSADQNDDLKVLQFVHQNLKPGGVFVLDIFSKEWFAANYQKIRVTRLENGALFMQRNEILDDWTLVKSKWVLIQGTDVRAFDFRARIFSGLEMKQLLNAAGFRDIRLCGDWDGSPYDINVKRLIAIARKSNSPLRPQV